MDTSPITEEQAEALCALGEDHFYDRKSAEMKPVKLTKPLSAFANADGGELFIGIEDDGTWRGRPSVEAYNGHVQALRDFFPYGTDFDYEFLGHPDGTFVLRITVQKTGDIRHANDGRVYVRRGAASIPIETEEELDLLRRRKGLTTHEVATLAYPEEEIDNAVVTLEFMLSVVPNSEPGPWLKKQGMIVDGNPTVAGTVLFHDEPQVHLPKAGVKIYRYTSSESEGEREQLAFDPVPIEGCVYAVIREAVGRTVAEVEKIPMLDESSGLRQISYPPEALHEIITNAVLHRDYALNDDVHVRIFDNRIEIESPGRLPAHITPENILSERYARNPRIVRLINKFPDPPNKDVGEGLNTAFAAMKRLQLADPQIIEGENSVLVLIRHEPLASPASRIIAHIEETGSINNGEARDLLNIDADRVVRRHFEDLVRSGEIERVPGTIKGGSRYQRVRRST